MDILGQQLNDAGSITIKVICQTGSGEMEFDISLDHKIPFNLNVQFILSYLFAQNIEKNYTEQIEYKFKQGIISSTEQRTLQELGITNGDVIKMKLTMKGGLL